LEFADAMIFIMAIPNLIGLYILAPDVKKDLAAYLDARQAG
jgi:AGCS family alanine or glycine:cation symporter